METEGLESARQELEEASAALARREEMLTLLQGRKPVDALTVAEQVLGRPVPGKTAFQGPGWTATHSGAEGRTCGRVRPDRRPLPGVPGD